MDFSWSQFKDTIDWLSKLITLIVTALGFIIAWRGISVWKKQLIGQTQYQLASEILLLLFKFRDAINKIRRPPFDYVNTKPDHLGKEHWASIEKQIAEIYNLFQELRVIKVKSGPYFPKELNDNLLCLLSHCEKLTTAISEEYKREIKLESSRAGTSENMSIVWATEPSEHDKFIVEFYDVIIDIQEVLYPILQDWGIVKRSYYSFKKSLRILKKYFRNSGEKDRTTIRPIKYLKGLHMAAENSVKVNHKMWFLLAIPIIIWLVFIYFGMEWSKADSLGALFSGLAFMGVALGLYFQTREINMQRKELQLQREEMMENRKVMKEQEQQMKMQKEALELQLENQKISSMRDYFVKLLESHIAFVKTEVEKDKNLYSEDLNLSNTFFENIQSFDPENNPNNYTRVNMLGQKLDKREVYRTRRFVTSASLILFAYENLSNDTSFTVQMKVDILKLIKSSLPMYQLCLFYYFAIHHKTYKFDNRLKRLIIEYLLDDFHLEIANLIISYKSENDLKAVNGTSEEYFKTMSDTVKESITCKLEELKDT